MSTEVIIDLMQIILLTFSIVVVMLVAAFRRDHALVSSLTAFGLLASLLVFQFVQPVLPLQVTPLLLLDSYSLFFSNLIIFGALVVTCLAYPYFEKRNPVNEEFYILLLIATLGGVVLACSSHFVAFFLGLEMISLCLYAMVAYPVHSDSTAKFPLEAGIKYLILSGTTSGTILFGIALIFAQTGTLSFMELGAAIEANGGFTLLLLVGVLVLLAGVAFKLSLVPFHMWTPDVYEGAPLPTTTFLATISKAAMLAAILRMLQLSGSLEIAEILVVLGALGAASMLLGNLLALLQNNMKRLLAYSSIGHMGYLTVVFVAASSVGEGLTVESLGYYVAAYFIMTLAAFGVVSALSHNERELDSVGDLKGLFWRNPWLALVMTTALLSLAGIPLTVGFIGKFYVFAAGVESSLWFLLAMVVLGSGIGLYYYLRLVYSMLLDRHEGLSHDPALRSLPAGVHLVLAVLTGAIIWLGVYPQPLIETLQGMTAAL